MYRVILNAYTIYIFILKLSGGAILSGMRKQLLILFIRLLYVFQIASNFWPLLFHTQAYLKKKCTPFSWVVLIIITNVIADKNVHHTRKSTTKMKSTFHFPTSFLSTNGYYFRHGMHQFVDVLDVLFYFVATEWVSPFSNSLFIFNEKRKKNRPVKIN